MESRHGAAGNRLAVDDWIRAGHAILAEDGLQALKIDRLCERLGLTKGSFYWHFEGVPSYRAALVQAWGNSVIKTAQHSTTRPTWNRAHACHK